MKSIRFAICAFAALSPLAALAADLKNDPGGFNGIPWGSPPAVMPQLPLLKEEGDLKIFTSSGPTPLICGIQPEVIKYQFYKDRFESVRMNYAGKETHENLVACALEHYGRIPPTKSRSVLRVDWEGPVTIISLTYDPYS